LSGAPGGDDRSAAPRLTGAKRVAAAKMTGTVERVCLGYQPDREQAPAAVRARSMTR
jgi:hypothetical protein